MRQAVVYRLYPSKSQQRGLQAILDTTRRWYNTCLEAREDAYEEQGVSLSQRNILRLGQSCWALSFPLGELVQEATGLEPMQSVTCPTEVVHSTLHTSHTVSAHWRTHSHTAGRHTR